MDILSTTIEIIGIIQSIYELCGVYRETDSTVRAIHLRLESVSTRIELFQEYFRHTQSSLTTARAKTLQRSLQQVQDLLQDLTTKLPPKSTVQAKLAWAGWGKRSAEGILADLKDWDEDVRGTIFALDMLSRVRGDQALYKRLFDTGERSLTAAWALSTRIHAPASADVLPPAILLSALTLFTPDDRRMLARLGPDLVYVEALYIERDGDEEQQKHAIARLAAVFHSPLLPAMHLLSCRGIAEDYDHDRAFVVYDLPSSFVPNPSPSPPPRPAPLPTLAHALEAQARIALEDRFRIALEITTAVLEMHAAGWVHKAIRSGTVLVHITAPTNPKATAHVSPAFLVGLEASRPQVAGSDRRPEMEPTWRRYHHPERQGGLDARVARFDLRHDMYSLGAVLVELGYRKTLGDIFGGSAQALPQPGEAEENHKRLVGYARRLGDKMGSKYTDAALVCLLKSTEEGKRLDDLRLEFYEDVLRPLSEIVAGFKYRRRTGI
ncbi:hypothetical protein FIBSPDRAFT_849350 [Athelia psychrophila]|uniref:Protein kinase domain-containing protein n=1 Tax=Athelia psychrophila TaxID=1759441 RepID=A0A166UMJ0_9AGAM|nr:hypothetical protein FIBSPDRAFT_849350 [Fibularhizoctonia sp. CBS 109695]